ncbi:MAG: glycoside hydrolase family 3 N-terminal domain-containing protein [Acidobacteriota bacterium]
MGILKKIVVILICLPVFMNSFLFSRDSGNWVKETMRKMTLKEKAAQMIFHVVYPNFFNVDDEYYKHLSFLIRDLKIGGFYIFKTPTYDLAYLLNKYQSWSKVPLLIAADMESGAGKMITREKFMGRNLKTFVPEYFSGGGIGFPPLMAVGATRSSDFAYQMGKITAVEAKSVGVHFNFSPVLDINNNPDNPIINFRSFGENAKLVKELGAAYIKGCQDAGMIATAKHFPGHGDTSTDTHIERPVSNFDMVRLEKLELKPFYEAISSGVKAIMSVHMALPEITGHKKPATLSKEILTDLLRKKMGFKGLIITDGMVMGGITNEYDDKTSSVEAVRAGADILLYLSKPEDGVDAIVNAVRKGEISQKRIEESVKRILEAKKWAGLDKSKKTDLDQIENVLGSKTNRKVAQQIADNSVTLLKNSNNILPLKKEKDYYFLRIFEKKYVHDGWFLKRYLEDHINIKGDFTLTQDSNGENIREIAEKIPPNSDIICPFFIYIGAWKGKSSIPVHIIEFLKELKAKNCNIVSIAFGNPYIYRDISFSSAYLCSYYSTRELEIATANILLGDSDPKGKFPVSIPGYFKFGEGLKFNNKRGEK